MGNTKSQMAIVDDESERKYRAPALEKGLDVLELLARSESPLTTSQMASLLGRSVSELFRMVLALEFRGYIEQASEGREGYSLTNKLFTLGIAQGLVRSLLETALPVMKELVYEVGQSCHLVVPSGDQIVVVGRIESPMDIGFSVRVGYRRRLIDTNSGLLLFGFSTPDTQEQWLPQLRDSASTDQIETFLARSKEVLVQGYVIRPSDFVEGVTDYCVPILGKQGAIASLIIPWISIKKQSHTREYLLERLQGAARKIADAMSHEGR